MCPLSFARPLTILNKSQKSKNLDFTLVPPYLLIDMKKNFHGTLSQITNKIDLINFKAYSIDLNTVF